MGFVFGAGGYVPSLIFKENGKIKSGILRSLLPSKALRDNDNDSYQFGRLPKIIILDQ